MTLEFDLLDRKELREAAELAARAFIDYEYFTNWFPDQEERSKVESSITRTLPYCPIFCTAG